jgi:hypothetical protein
MKTILSKVYIFCLLSLALASCEKDEEKLVVQPGTSPTLTASATAPLVLTKDNAEVPVVTFSWTPADYGYPAAVNYTLQYDVKGNNFAAPQEVALVNALQKEFTVSGLNALATKLSLTPETAADMEFRIKTDISPSIEPTFSAPITINVTPYLDLIEYASLWVPGQYQGWAPDAAPKISSVSDNGIYEGYVYMNVADGFKFTSAPDWSHTNYGDGGPGKLSTDGGAGNLTVSTPGYYQLQANTTELTCSAKKTNWGVIGDATGSWDNDKDLTYDTNTQVWTATLPLSVGEIKFRANDAWEINLGGAKSGDGKLAAGGDNIKVTEAGTYLITLDLSHPGNYSYSLKKQ